MRTKLLAGLLLIYMREAPHVARRAVWMDSESLKNLDSNVNFLLYIDEHRDRGEAIGHC